MLGLYSSLKLLQIAKPSKVPTEFTVSESILIFFSRVVRFRVRQQNGGKL